MEYVRSLQANVKRLSKQNVSIKHAANEARIYLDHEDPNVRGALMRIREILKILER